MFEIGLVGFSKYRKSGKMKFYKLDNASGNIVKSYPKMKVDFEFLATEDNLADIQSLEREVLKLLKSAGFSPIDQISRTYLSQDEKLLYYLKHILVVE